MVPFTWDVCVCVCSVMSDSFAAPWTVAHQAPLSKGFPRQEYWSGLPFPSPGDLPHAGIEPSSPMSPALAGGFFTTSATWEALQHGIKCSNTWKSHSPVTGPWFSSRYRGREEKAALAEGSVLGFEEGELEVVAGNALEIDKSRMYKGASDQRKELKKTSPGHEALLQSSGVFTRSQNNEPT